MSNQPTVDHNAPHVAARGRRSTWAAGLSLAALLAAVYYSTLYPGVWKGDAAELQYMSALLGVCHPPGYGLEIAIGNLFAHLPLGPGVAWRINLMQVVCGVAGAVLFFALLRRLTGRVWPALVAAATLGLSVTYWRKSVLADVYVFYALFLLAGIYCLVRFVQGGGRRWFHLAALLTGVAVTNRPSELLILPGLAALWWLSRHQARLRVRDVLAGAVLALLPLAFNVGWYLVREKPTLLHARDDAMRDRILGAGSDAARTSPTQRVIAALRYSLGLEAAGRESFTQFSWSQVGWDASKLGWQLSGLGLLRDRYRPEQVQQDEETAFRQRQQGRGASLTALGLLLAAWGLSQWRRARPAVLLALGLTAGNLAYYFYMHPVDNLDFLLPALIGLCILLALGVDGLQQRRRRLALAAACVPLALLAGNYRFVSPRGVAAAEVADHMQLCEAVKVTPLPRRTVILASYSRAQTLRHLYWVETPRRDVHVFIFRELFDSDALARLVSALRKERYVVLLSAEKFSNSERREMFAAWTPAELVEVGFYYAYPRRFKSSVGRPRAGGAKRRGGSPR